MVSFRARLGICMKSKSDRFIRELSPQQKELASLKLMNPEALDGIPVGKNYQDELTMALYDETRQTLKKMPIFPGNTIHRHPPKKRRNFCAEVIEALDLENCIDDFYSNILTFLPANSPHAIIACMNLLYLIDSSTFEMILLDDTYLTPIKTVTSLPAYGNCVLTSSANYLGFYDINSKQYISRQDIGDYKHHYTYANDSCIFLATDTMFRVTDFRQSKTIAKLEFESSITGLNGHNNWLCTSTYDGGVFLWDIRQLSEPVASFDGHTNTLKAISFSPFNSDLFVTGGGTDDRQLILWSISQQKAVTTLLTDQQFCTIHWVEPDLLFTNGRLETNGISNLFQLGKHENKPAIKERWQRLYENRVTYSAQSPNNAHRFFSISDSTLLDASINPDNPVTEPASTHSNRLESLRTLR